MMNRFEGPGGKEARIRYLDGDFQVTSPGSFVRCALAKSRIEEVTERLASARADHVRFAAPAEGLFLVRVRY